MWNIKEILRKNYDLRGMGNYNDDHNNIHNNLSF
jgi:hypothetical protein